MSLTTELMQTSVRLSLGTLSDTKSIQEEAQGRIISGKKVNSPLDDRVKYYQAKRLSNRVNLFNERKLGLQQAVYGLNVTNDGIESIMNSLKGIRSQITNLNRATSKEELEVYKSIIAKSIFHTDGMVDDTEYKGLHFLQSTKVKSTIYFTSISGRKMEIEGINLQSSNIKLNGELNQNKWINETSIENETNNLNGIINRIHFDTASQVLNPVSLIDSAVNLMEEILHTVKSKSILFAGKYGILKNRMDFSDGYTHILDQGVDDITNADKPTEISRQTAAKNAYTFGRSVLKITLDQQSEMLKLLQ